MTEGTLTRAAPSPARSWNPETLTFEAVLSTGAPVARRDARGVFDEVLALDSASYPDSIPLLDSHRQDSLDRRLGEVGAIRLEGNALVGVARLSRNNEQAQRIAADLSDGARLGVSIGYRVGKWSERIDPATRRRTMTGTEITLLEASLVAVPADQMAGIRSNPESECEMTEVNTTQTRAAINAEIRSLASSVGLPAEWANRHIDNETDMDAVRASALSELATRSTTTTIRATVTNDSNNDPAAIRSAMADALACRLAPSVLTLEGRAREYAGHSAADLLNDLAAQRGQRLKLRSLGDIFSRAEGDAPTDPTLLASDFAALTADAANKALNAQYQAAAPSYRLWAAKRSFNDFKSHKFLRVGDFPAFTKSTENAAVAYGDVSENAETVTAYQHDAAIKISRHALINDDLSALADFSAAIAARAAADENAWVYGVLAANAALSDGKALFHADHANKAATGAKITVASVGAAFSTMRKQKGLDGVPLNVVPKFLICGPDKETEARQFVANITPAQVGDANPYTSALEVVVDANITGNGWYVMADPAAVPTIVYGWLAGSEGPEIRTEIDFETRALKIAAGLDFGTGAIDFRGAYSNAGA